MSGNTIAEPVVIVDERKCNNGLGIGIATLNAPKSLNALTLDMIRRLDAQLQQWAADPRIACVVLRGGGTKAFCAGGDVRSVREAILAHHGQPAPNPQAHAFFSEEYRLDHRIHTYSRPILVWGSGIIMGGGVGLLAGASHRVVTETSRIAMPEITIGLFPDVGGSWFLSRMPGRIGLFLALTGAPINGADAMFVGLADFFVRSTDYETVLQRLTAVEWSTHAADNHVALSKQLRQFANDAAELKPTSSVRAYVDDIERLADGDTLAEVVASIVGYRGDDVWLQKAAATLANGSPTSAALTWELRHRTRHMSLAEVFRTELIVAVQCCAHADFAEGVRALLVDKDRQPRWTPATINEVSAALIEEHFVAPWSASARVSQTLDDL